MEKVDIKGQNSDITDKCNKKIENSETNQNIQTQPAILVMVAKGVPKPETDVDSIHSQPGVFQNLTGMATILLQEKNSPIRKRKLYFPARECKNWESQGYYNLISPLYIFCIGR